MPTYFLKPVLFFYQDRKCFDMKKLCSFRLDIQKMKLYLISITIYCDFFYRNLICIQKLEYSSIFLRFSVCSLLRYYHLLFIIIFLINKKIKHLQMTKNAQPREMTFYHLAYKFPFFSVHFSIFNNGYKTTSQVNL